MARQQGNRPIGPRRRRGVMLVLSTFLMIVMFAFAAFAVDLGLIVLTQAQLQNAADAAALAAVLELKTADPTLTQEEIRNRAINQAKAVALLNFAASRPVQLIDDDIVLGNRSFDNEKGKWVTIYEHEPNFGLRKFNAVQVNVAFDQGAGGRRKLDLLFARALGEKTAEVSSQSRSHLTPRDLIFCIDTSGSMFGDSGGNTPTAWSSRSRSWTQRFLGNIYGNKRPTREFDVSRKGQYQWLWEQAMSNGAFGSSSQTAQFIAQEFPDAGSEPWNHWKWQAYCDAAFCTDGGNNWQDPDTANLYWGDEGQLMNKNVICATTLADSNDDADFGPESYTTFCVWSGYIPAIRGQRFYPRDHNNDDVLDDTSDPTIIPKDLDAPQPDFVGYYPRVADLDNYDYRLLFDSSGKFTGVYPNSVDARPMSIVRQATLFGVYSMIEGEEQFNREIVFNQVGLVTFATMAHTDLDLSNDLQTTLQVSNSRLTTYPGNRYIEPHGSGATNIGMGIRMSIRILTRPGGRGRSFASKTIALLTDGDPNYSPQGGFDDPYLEYDGQTQTVVNNTNRGRDYARYWANKCGQMDITLHTIGLGGAGTGSRASFLQDLAESGNGVFVPVTSVRTSSEQQQLRDLFIAIGKDKLGKLYLE